MKNGYDYLVVGGGSAGCVLAARLSEDPAVQVALIEAGPIDDAPEVHIPAAFPQLFKSRHDWDYSSEPEPALGGRRIYLPRGKVLGGSSSMNAMVYIRGNRADYDEWAAEGATGWSYDEILPYFIKAEANERGASSVHGADGPLSVQEGRSQHPLIDRIIDAWRRFADYAVMEYPYGALAGAEGPLYGIAAILRSVAGFMNVVTNFRVSIPMVN